MAGMSVTSDDCMDDYDEGCEMPDFGGNILEDDSSLPPLQRVQKYAQSTDAFVRQMVGRVVQEILRTTPKDALQDDLPAIMKIVMKIGDESILRADLLEQIPHIAASAAESGLLKDVVSDYLIPFVVRNLGWNTAVDKAAQTALFQLLEAGYVSQCDAEIKICPSVLALSKFEKTADTNTKAISLMSKLAHFLGRDVTERVFLKRLEELCISPIFLVRKVCADHFGQFCIVIGPDAYERTLLPCYRALCQDEHWAVRKACAEQITYMSCVSPSLLRKELLAPAFDKLLKDDTRWVRMAAFQSLGPFLSTFSDPVITHVEHEKDGGLKLTNHRGNEFVLTPIPTLIKTDRFASFMKENKSDLEPQSQYTCFLPHSTLARASNLHVVYLNMTDDQDDFSLNDSSNEIQIYNSENADEINSNTVNEQQFGDNSSIENGCDLDKVNFNNSEDRIEEDDLHLFNSYNYWNVRLDLPLDPRIVSGSDCSTKDVDDARDVGTNLENLYSKLALDDTLSESTTNNTTVSLEERNNSISEESLCTKVTIPPQNIVPQYLVDHYISMTDPTQFINVDNDMTYHCAYSLPATVTTLGKENWPLLKSTVDSLASDVQYKVRRTVASGLHEIAEILGPELATEDLTPLFEGFLKDLDEVRIGVLKHLAHFLRLIDQSKRNTYLPKLSDFLQTDNESNWRFREELAKQLIDTIPLFRPCDTAKYIVVITIHLLCDKIAAIRDVALTLMTDIVKYMSSETIMKRRLLITLTEHFAHSKQWKRRQMFCLLCTELLKEKALGQEQFASEIMPHLLDLSWDPVANVRLVVARCLSQYIMVDDYFKNTDNENCDGLETVLKRLQADKDRDVRHSAEL